VIWIDAFLSLVHVIQTAKKFFVCKYVRN
jgi:hypothetical protein